MAEKKATTTPRTKTKRQIMDSLCSQLEMERSSFIGHWRQLAEQFMPRRARFTASDTNKGDRRNHNIIDSTGLIAIRTLRAGMMAGITSPARPWFKLSTGDAELDEKPAVKDWCHTVQRRMQTKFLKSNLYNTLPLIYGDAGLFATAAMYIEEDFETAIHCWAFQIGTYSLACDDKGRVNTFTRDFRMTVDQLIERFGITDQNEIDWSKFSNHVRSLYEDGNTQTWIDVRHVIKPNNEYDPNRLESQYKRFCSVYFEIGSAGPNASSYLKEDDMQRFLSEKGYDYFPVLAPRWERSAEDVYGTSCPGMDALGDVKALQNMQKRKAQAIEKKINPPLIGSSRLKGSKTSMLPGDVNYDDSEAGRGLRPLHEVNFSLSEFVEDIRDHQTRVQRVLFEDLFLMLANSDRRQITAREIDERHEEKLLALGPVLEQLNQDLLDPLIEITFNIMLEQGEIPEAPEELAGRDLRVEYISVMAQAQKLVGIGGLERLTQYVTALAPVDPNVMQKFNSMQAIEHYADMVSVPPNVLKSNEDVEAVLAEQGRQAQAQQAAAVIAQGAGAARDLSQADVSGDNALNRVMQLAQAGS